MSEVRLIDANAAADKIMRETEVHADEIGVGGVALMIGFARALRDETNFPTIDAQPVWIPCSGKPEIGQEVLVALNNKGYKSIHIGEMYEESWLIDGEYWYDKDDPSITHWMPLPEPPEGGD